jgi:hypothetical protein
MKGYIYIYIYMYNDQLNILKTQKKFYLYQKVFGLQQDMHNLFIRLGNIGFINLSIQLILDYLFCYINLRTANYCISPRHVNSPEWLLGWKYSPKSFYTRFWRVGERWFPTLGLVDQYFLFSI